MEHVNKISFLVRPNVQFSSMEHYVNMTKETIKGNIEEFELSRIFACDQGKNQNTL